MPAIAGIPHLLRGPTGRYTWRRRWPRSAGNPVDATSCGKSFLSFSLRTDVRAEAMTLARRITALAEPLFAAVAGKSMPIDRATAEHLLTDLVRFEIAAADHARAMAPWRPLEAAEAEARREAALQATLRQAIYLRDREVARAPLRAVAERLGLALDETDPDWASLAMEATRVLIDISEERARRDRGIYDGPAPVFRTAMRRIEAAAPAAMVPMPLDQARGWFGADPAAAAAPGIRAAPVPAAAAPAIPAGHRAPDPAHVAGAPAAAPDRRKGGMNPAGPTLEDAFRVYIEARAAGKDARKTVETANAAQGASWRKNSMENLEGTRRLLGRFFGATPLARITGDNLAEFFSLLQRVPSNHGKSPGEEPDLRDLVAMADAKERMRQEQIRLDGRRAGTSEGNVAVAVALARIPRMRVNTIYRHMQDTKRMFRYAMVRGEIGSNPMDEVIWSSKTMAHLLALEEDEGRLPWERSHVEALFRSPIYREPLEDQGDPLFWAPLVALFASLREEEALQLLTDDVRDIDGVTVFDLRKGAGKAFKTGDSVRRVPVHQALIDLGLLDLVRLRQAQGEARLFPYLTRGPKREKFSENYSRTFTRYRERAQIYDPQRDFHALRTTFNVELIRARVDSPIRKSLMGHKIHDVNWEHYSGEGYGLEHLRDVVNLIDIDTSMIRKPFGAAPAAICLADRKPALRVVG